MNTAPSVSDSTNALLKKLVTATQGVSGGGGSAFPSASSMTRAGNAVLVGGTITVTEASVTANTIVILSRKTNGGTVGTISYTVSAGASFTINSTSGTDTSTVSYLLVEST